MSLREEDRQKNGCPSRGLGLAAAAIGVGVGAALYYFFSKRPENPANEGATSQEWACESPQTLDGDSTDSYFTLSENTTSDTSINEDSIRDSPRDSSRENSLESLGFNWSINEDVDMSYGSDYRDDFNESSNDSDSTTSRSNESSNHSDSMSNSSSRMSISSSSSSSDNDMDFVTRDDDPEYTGWEVETSLDVPRFEPPTSSPLRSFVDRLFSPRLARSRERSWSLEECSICFEVILRNQEVMSLPCTHHFHQACILPWLQEQQTCPNCRKAID